MVRKQRLVLPALDPALSGLRVVVVADLHAGAAHVKEARLRRVAERVRSQRADLVCLLGDFVDPQSALARRVEPAAAAGPWRGLGARLGTFAVLGNHDWAGEGDAMLEALSDAGITVLENRAIPVPGVDAPLWLAGLADLSTRDPDPALLDDLPAEATVIVLSHDPDPFVELPAGVALTLAGHTHGGQIGIPRLRRAAIPSRFGERFARGHIVEGARHLFVTSGVGTSRLPVRLLVPPEIAVLELRAAV